MLGRDPFIAEVTVDLVHPFNAADGEPLEVELGRNAEKELHVERVVVRHERPRQRAARDRLHHRRLDFEIAARVQESAEAREHPAADLEHAPRILVDDEIEVALPVADLDVAQAVPLFGQRQETLDQELELRDVDRQLVGPRAKQVPFDADEIAEVEQLEDLEVTLADRVLTDVGLDLGLAIRDRDEVGLAEAADRQDAARGLRLDAFGGELVAGPVAVARHQVAHSVRAIERVRIRSDSETEQRLEVGAPLRHLVGFFVLLGAERLACV